MNTPLVIKILYFVWQTTLVYLGVVGFVVVSNLLLGIFSIGQIPLNFYTIGIVSIVLSIIIYFFDSFTSSD
jgi:hypothetical protein